MALLGLDTNVEDALRGDGVTAGIRVLGYGNSHYGITWKPKHLIVAYFSVDEFLEVVAEALTDDT
ncbi:MAG: hypothetical protein GC179_27375 [Anaerolineaceae bacterium]|nr:hypothetical protein [Anaerolineaceae bacterium]